MKRRALWLLGVLLAAAAGALAPGHRDGAPPAAYGNSPPAGSGWVLAGYQNHYYTYYVTEQVGTTTVTQYLYSVPQDRVVYSPETRLSAITWYSQPTWSYTRLLTYRSSCWLNPYYPWDMQCYWMSEWRTDQYYQPAQQYWYTTVNVPTVVTDYVPVYGSVQVPVYQRVPRTGVCALPVYRFVGGSGTVIVNGDGTFTMWVPQSSCVYSPYTNVYQQVTPQAVYTGQSCGQQLNAALIQSTSQQTVFVWTSITYGVATGYRYQCQTIYVPTWTLVGSSGCGQYVIPECQGEWRRVIGEYYSPDGLVRYVRSEYHPACVAPNYNCIVYCIDDVYRLTNQPQWDCRNMPYDWIQMYQAGENRQNTSYSYSEHRWYTTRCWHTLALTTSSALQNELVDRYVPSTGWQQMTFRMPSMPDARIGINPGAVGLTGLASWFWVENVAPSESVAPNGIRARLVPVRYDWDFNGDGQLDLSTTSPGRPYPQPSDVAYTYQRSSLSQRERAYRVQVMVVYELQVDAGDGYRTVGEMAQERMRLYPVQQLQSALGE